MAEGYTKLLISELSGEELMIEGRNDKDADSPISSDDCSDEGRKETILKEENNNPKDITASKSFNDLEYLYPLRQGERYCFYPYIHETVPVAVIYNACLACTYFNVYT